MAFCGAKMSVLSRSFHTTLVAQEIRKLARLRVVDNCEIGKRAMLEGKPPRCIQVYNKSGVGLIGRKKMFGLKMIVLENLLLIVYCLMVQVTRSC